MQFFPRQIKTYSSAVSTSFTEERNESHNESKVSSHCESENLLEYLKNETKMDKNTVAKPQKLKIVVTTHYKSKQAHSSRETLDEIIL